MSGRIVGEVLKYAPADVTHLELLLLVALAESARDSDRRARYSTSCEALADLVRSTPGSVRNALQRLRDRGLVIPLHEKPRRGLAQQYELTPMGAHTRKATLT